jgi:hypothetical protein
MPTENTDTFDAAFAEVVAAMEAGDTVPAAAAEPAAAAAEPAPEPAAAEPAPEPAAAAAAAESAAEPTAAAAVPAAEPAATEPMPAPTAEPATAPAPVASAPAPAPELAETPEAKAEREAFEASIAPYMPSEDEARAMEQFKKDFPNEAVAIEARLKSVDREINARIHRAVQNLFQHVEGRLTPVEQTVTQSALEQHVSALHAAHADYDAVIGKVPAWIDTLPSYAQVGARAVFERGTTQEVINLVSDYKKATQAPAPAPTAPATAPAPKTPPAGADDLAPVSARRSAVVPNGAPDPNDYDGAFKEAVAAMGK